MDPLKSPVSPSNKPADGSDDPKLNDVPVPSDAGAPTADSPLGDLATDSSVSKPAEVDESLGLADESPASDKPLPPSFGDATTPPAAPQPTLSDTPAGSVTTPDTSVSSEGSSPTPFAPSVDTSSTAPVTAPGSHKSALMLGIVVGLVLLVAIILMVVL